MSGLVPGSHENGQGYHCSWMGRDQPATTKTETSVRV